MQENRPRSTRRGREDREERRPSPVDYDYMGREVPRNEQRLKQAPNQQFYGRRDDGARHNGYQRRGNPYQVGQSYRFMQGYQQDRDPYFQQYDQPPRRNGQGFRGGRDQPRPGYFPASRNPKRVDQLVDDFDGGYNQRRF